MTAYGCGNAVMRVVSIVEGTSVDGPGLRTAIYFSGCRHHCPGCQNPSTWDLNSGQEMTVDEIVAAIEGAENRGVTFTGGDPLMQAGVLAFLAGRLKESGHDIWCYTGYTFEQVNADETLRSVLPYIDVLVDGRYVEALRDTRNLLFRGSSNQRLVDVGRSLCKGEVVEWIPDTEVHF